jgi:TrpR-related protein YerC/YecD
MKHRSIAAEPTTESPVDSLCRAMLALENVSEMRAFLQDLCTPAELEALADRWRVVPYLLRGMPYREIHERTAVSVTTIGRVARFLSQGNGGYRAAIEHHAIPKLRLRGDGTRIKVSGDGTRMKVSDGTRTKVSDGTRTEVRSAMRMDGRDGSARKEVRSSGTRKGARA